MNKARVFFTRFFCFLPKIEICCHPAATRNMPKYWHYRRLVAGWQQNLKILIFIIISKQSTPYTSDR
jgi:hypothetical protein